MGNIYCQKIQMLNDYTRYEIFVDKDLFSLSVEISLLIIVVEIILLLSTDRIGQKIFLVVFLVQDLCPSPIFLKI